MEFLSGDYVRFGFGFANPNHAAAAVCAVLPFLWGLGRVASHSRGDQKTTYAYDHFGRLVSQKEDGVETAYAYDRYGNRTSRISRNRKGEIVSKETRVYDRYGRLAETAAFGSSVKYAYDAKGRISRQTIDGELIEYAYTRRGQLAGKYLGGKLKPDAAVEYEYSRNGQVAARTSNGVRQTYEYDLRGQLVGVREGEEYVERYAYDKAGNMLRKTVRGKTTAFAFDEANQLVSSTCEGVTTRYEYDAAGRLVREGDRTYTYGYLDKVMSVRDGKGRFAYTYHPDGQLATADYGNGKSEDFAWDGLALIRRGDEQFINEPHVGGGNPVVSSKGASYFNDMLGTTVGVKSGRKYSAATLTAFGEDLDSAVQPFFTGKPMVEGLGHAFLFRNYRAGLGKWQTADPMGYPDGWNQLAYCGNGVTSSVDLWGCANTKIVRFNTDQSYSPIGVVIPWYNSEWDGFGLAKQEAEKAHKAVKDWVNEKLKEYKKDAVNATSEILADYLMIEMLKYFSKLQGGEYNECVPSESEDPWKSILEKNESEGWTLESGPTHTGVSVDYDSDVTNAGLGALIVEGCTHHWEAKFVKE